MPRQTTKSPVRLIGLVLLLGLLGACAPRALLVPPPLPQATADAPAPAPTLQRVWLATNRKRDGLNGTGARSDMMSFARLDIAIPADHQPGLVNSESFGVANYAQIASMPALARSLARAPGNDEIMLFIHGYNTTMAEALYRHAQIAHDFDMNGPQLTFSWPSAGNPGGYAYDRDSVAIARDPLEQLLSELARQGRPVLIMAHSMGAQLVVETLRQMQIGGNQAALDALSAVVLMSPDIDKDRFKAHMERLTPLPAPMVVFVSQEDRYLRLSARVTGQRARLGSTSDLEVLRALGVTVIDVSNFEGQGDGNHFVAATSPALISVLRGMRETLPREIERGPTIIDVAEAALGG